ncbi:MAG: sialidase family protein [Sphingobacterium sp.]
MYRNRMTWMSMSGLVCMLFILGTGFLNACKSEVTQPGIDKPDEQPDEDSTAGFDYVYQEETRGYQVFRIPAIVKSKSGKLLAFAEARKLKSNGDSGDIDMVVKISEDNGETWGDMVMIWDDGLNTCGNPVPIVDEETGRIHLLLSWNHGEDRWGDLVDGTGQDVRRAFYTWSDDEGETWEDPQEITESVKNENWDWYATGPVHGIQIKKGPHAGRLVAPNYFTVRENEQHNDYSHVVYSDDNGKTWRSGAPTLSGGVGECTVAELSDGKLMLNMRAGSGAARKFCISEDGGETWGDVQTDHRLIDPSCQGSLFSDVIKDEHTLFFANAASGERTNMTVKKSTDDGADWTSELLIHQGPSAYSDVVVTDNGKVALLYEGGVGRPYEGIAIKLIDLKNLN